MVAPWCGPDPDRPERTGPGGLDDSDEGARRRQRAGNLPRGHTRCRRLQRAALGTGLVRLAHRCARGASRVHRHGRAELYAGWDATSSISDRRHLRCRDPGRGRGTWPGGARRGHRAGARRAARPRRRSVRGTAGAGVVSEQAWEAATEVAPDEITGPLPVVAVVGRPNVGKSTLVNRILGRRAAVVEDVPGVTRDRVAYDANWAGRQFTVVDTGGWDTEATGMAGRISAQAELAVTAADVVLFVVDVRTGVTDADDAVVAILRRAHVPVILVANKVDGPTAEAEAATLWNLGLGEPYSVSALHGRGSGDLLDVVLEALPSAPRETLEEPEQGPRRVALVGKPHVGQASLPIGR